MEGTGSREAKAGAGIVVVLALALTAALGAGSEDGLGESSSGRQLVPGLMTLCLRFIVFLGRFGFLGSHLATSFTLVGPRNRFWLQLPHRPCPPTPLPPFLSPHLPLLPPPSPSLPQTCSASPRAGAAFPSTAMARIMLFFFFLDC